ncbi:MAG: hypothetical protein JJE18_03350 [Eubacteriaceae bacterium]|nr:hypothetical protein [Eubacteriaceae bacterium]
MNKMFEKCKKVSFKEEAKTVEQWLTDERLIELLFEMGFERNETATCPNDHGVWKKNSCKQSNYFETEDLLSKKNRFSEIKEISLAA